VASRSASPIGAADAGREPLARGDGNPRRSAGREGL